MSRAHLSLCSHRRTGWPSSPCSKVLGAVPRARGQRASSGGWRQGQPQTDSGSFTDLESLGPKRVPLAALNPWSRAIQCPFFLPFLTHLAQATDPPSGLISDKTHCDPHGHLCARVLPTPCSLGPAGLPAHTCPTIFRSSQSRGHSTPSSTSLSPFMHLGWLSLPVSTPCTVGGAGTGGHQLAEPWFAL